MPVQPSSSAIPSSASPALPCPRSSGLVQHSLRKRRGTFSEAVISVPSRIGYSIVAPVIETFPGRNPPIEISSQ